MAFTFRTANGAKLIRPISARYMHKKKIERFEAVPRMKNDREAEAFLDRDLSDLDFTQFKPAKFEFQAKDAQTNMRLPSTLLNAVKARAKRDGLPYQRFIRETLERAVAARKKA